MTGTIVHSFFFPIVIAAITYWSFRKNDEWISHKQYSLLGVVIMNRLLEEVKNGITIMRSQHTNPLPAKSWTGTPTVPDEVLLLIIAVAGDQSSRGFNPQEIRIHAKNYFEHMAPNWEASLRSGNMENIQKLLHQDK